MASSPLDHLDIVEVERAAVDLRRGLPVVLESKEGRAILALTPETVSRETFDAARAMAAPDAAPLAAITVERAETLKARLYTKPAVLVPLDTGLGEDLLGRARVLADPSADITNPLGGPYNALRNLGERPAEEAIKLAKIAGLLPAVIVLDVPDGMAAQDLARAHRLTLITTAAVAGYDLGITDTLRLVTRAKVPLSASEQSELAVFRSAAGGPEHYAVILGDPDVSQPVLARIHSECFTGDLLGSLKCDCGDQLRGALSEIAEAGSGILLYLAQEGRGIGLPNKLRAYRLQDEGFDTVDANTRLGFEVDERFFHPAAAMLRALGVESIRLMTNNPDKVAAMETLGVRVASRVAHKFETNAHNEHYLLTKKSRTGHLL